MVLSRLIPKFCDHGCCKIGNLLITKIPFERTDAVPLYSVTFMTGDTSRS